MLKNISLSNFKAWREVEVPFGRVTGLFGTNSSGKSSLLQSLLMLKQTKDAADHGLALHFGGRGRSNLVQLGGFRDVVHRNDESLAIGWTLEWTLPKILKLPDPSQKRTKTLHETSLLGTTCCVRKHGANLRTDELSYLIGDAVFRLARDARGKYALSGADQDGADYPFLRTRERPWSLPGPVKTHLFPDQAKTFYQNTGFLGILETEYEKLMDSIYYLGPLREPPRREYFWSGTSPHDTGTRGERAVDAILSATRKGEKRNLAPRKRLKPFQEMIQYWLDRLDLASKFSIDEIASAANLYRARVTKDRSSVEATLPDVGFGVSQVLPALVLLYYVPKGSIVLMEQPEIRLHPSVQGGLADVILAAARSRDIQVIVESHSEHLLRRLQRRVAEREATTDDVKLFFTGVADGAAWLSDLELDELGEIRNWPPFLFGDRFSELAAINEATLRRRGSNDEEGRGGGGYEPSHGCGWPDGPSNGQLSAGVHPTHTIPDENGYDFAG